MVCEIVKLGFAELNQAVYQLAELGFIPKEEVQSWINRLNSEE